MIVRLILLVALLNSLQARSANDAPGWNLYRSYARHVCRMQTEMKQQIFFRASSEEKVVALTFDDGPLGRTPSLLRLLKKHNTPATFFLLAPQITKAKALQYDDPLFEVGLHSYHHLDYRKLSPQRVRRELDRALKIFHRHGLHPRFFRPPYGMVSRVLLRELKKRNLHTILWSIDSQDWNHYRGKRLIHNIVRSLAPGSVILLHDQSTSLNDISTLINAIEEAKYRIAPLSTLLSKGNMLPCP